MIPTGCSRCPTDTSLPNRTAFDPVAACRDRVPSASRSATEAALGESVCWWVGDPPELKRLHGLTGSYSAVAPRLADGGVDTPRTAQTNRLSSTRLRGRAVAPRLADDGVDTPCTARTVARAVRLQSSWVYDPRAYQLLVCRLSRGATALHSNRVRLRRLV